MYYQPSIGIIPESVKAAQWGGWASLMRRTAKHFASANETQNKILWNIQRLKFVRVVAGCVPQSVMSSRTDVPPERTPDQNRWSIEWRFKVGQIPCMTHMRVLHSAASGGCIWKKVGVPEQVETKPLQSPCLELSVCSRQSLLACLKFLKIDWRKPCAVFAALSHSWAGWEWTQPLSIWPTGTRRRLNVRR